MHRVLGSLYQRSAPKVQIAVLDVCAHCTFANRPLTSCKSPMVVAGITARCGAGSGCKPGAPSATRSCSHTLLFGTGVACSPVRHKTGLLLKHSCCQARCMFHGLQTLWRSVQPNSISLVASRGPASIVGDAVAAATHSCGLTRACAASRAAMPRTSSGRMAGTAKTGRSRPEPRAFFCGGCAAAAAPGPAPLSAMVAPSVLPAASDDAELQGRAAAISSCGMACRSDMHHSAMPGARGT